MTTDPLSELGKSVDELRLDLAHDHDRRARELEKVLSEGWVELGAIVATVDDNEEWKLLGFQSLHGWLKDACPKSKSIGYAAAGAWRELKDDFTDSELRQFTHENAHVMKLLPREVRKRPAVIEAAKTEGNRAFVRTAQQASPESHIEHRQPRKFKLTDSQEEEIDQAIELMRRLHDDPVMPEAVALAGIAVEWAQDRLKELQDEKAMAATI